jgi:hypothetical protein
MSGLERKPAKCCKCGEESPCVYDWRTDEFAKVPDGWPMENPWAVWKVEGEETENVTWGCPTHGEFLVLKSGEQKFCEPDTWVLGPNGERLFST